MTRLKTARIFFSVLFTLQWVFIIGITTLCIVEKDFAKGVVPGLIICMIYLVIFPMIWVSTMLYDLFLCRRDNKEKQ